MMGQAPEFAGCETCTKYADRRGPKVMPQILRVATRHKLRPANLATSYFEGVHARHLSGGSL